MPHRSWVSWRELEIAAPGATGVSIQGDEGTCVYGCPGQISPFQSGPGFPTPSTPASTPDRMPITQVRRPRLQSSPDQVSWPGSPGPGMFSETDLLAGLRASTHQRNHECRLRLHFSRSPCHRWPEAPWSCCSRTRQSTTRADQRWCSSVKAQGSRPVLRQKLVVELQAACARLV